MILKCNEYMKKCWTLKPVREMQIKTKIRYRYTLTIMATIEKKRSDNIVLKKIWDTQNTHTILIGTQFSIISFENYW